MHQGMTSSDVLDTTFNVQLVRAADILLADVDRVLAALKKPRLRAQGHGAHRALPRHPCRADHDGPDLRALLCRDGPQQEPAGKGQVGNRHRRHLRRGRHLRQYRPGGRGACLREARPAPRADLHAGHPARPARNVLCHARRDRQVDRERRDRDPPHAAHRGAGSRRILFGGPEGLLRHAAQAQSGPDREPDRPCAPRAHGRDPGDGERGALARARHLAQLGRARDRPRCHRSRSISR